MKQHNWVNKVNPKKQGYNRCLDCGLNKVYIGYVNGYLYFYDHSEQTKVLPKCKNNINKLYVQDVV